MDVASVAGEHDTLWCVRFLLSHRGDVGKAISAAVSTLQHRHSYRLDEVRAFATSHPRSEWPGYATVQEAAPFAVYHPDPSRGPYVCVRHALANYHILHERPGAYEEFRQHITHLNEWLAGWCDAITRQTGLITKACRLEDFQGFTIKQMSWKVLNRVTSDAKKTPDLYPQQLGSLCAFHTPPIATGLWATIRPLMPPRAAQKFGIFDVSNKASAHRLEEWIALEHLPSWLGGSASTPWPPPDATSVLLPVDEARGGGTG